MTIRFTRRDFLKASAVATGAAAFRDSAAAATVPAQSQPGASAQRVLARGPFAPTWDSLTKNYRVPEWFRDAKFGIWAHWTAQCVPEQGDWYARRMYLAGRLGLRLPRQDVRPSVQGRLHGDRPPLEGGALGAGEADGALQAGRREILLRAWPTTTTTSTPTTPSHHAWNSVNVGPEEGHRRHLGQGRPRAGAAVRRQQPLGACVALVPGGLRLRRRRSARGRALRCGPADEGRRRRQVVGGPRSAGALHRAQHRDPGWPDHASRR